MAYQDLIQPPFGITTTTTTFPPNTNEISVLSPDGLIFSQNESLSNGSASKPNDDFTIISPYIHYNNSKTVISFDPKSFLEFATIKFNLYSSTYRNAS